MIKINLALKKHAAAIESKAGAGAKLSLKGIDTEIVKDPQFRKLVLVIIVAFMANYVLGGYENDQVNRLTQHYNQLSAQNMKLQAQLAKTAGYEALKKQLDDDAHLIQTKLTTIQNLIADRKAPPSILASLSSEIPKQVWLSELHLNDQELSVKGYALGFDPISDFMKGLGDNQYITDVKLEDSKKTDAPLAGQVTSFSLDAERKQQ